MFAAYPLVPWIGVTAAGYALGPIFDWAPVRRRAFLLRPGARVDGGVPPRAPANLYGDPVAWSVQSSAVRTALSFLNATNTRRRSCTC